MRGTILGMRYPTLLLVFVLGCPPSKTPTPQPYDVPCHAAEANLLTLGCTDSKGALLGGPTKKGKSYTDFCVESLNNGIDTNPLCCAKAKSCEEVNACPLP